MKDISNNKIVAINDVPDQLTLLAVVLRDAGYDVLTAESAVEGINAARRELPDLIISDVMMPEMDGIELCRLIRADDKLKMIPIMLVSALRKDAANMVEGLQGGADDYIEVPYDPLNLAARAARLIERKRMEDLLRKSEKRFRSLIENSSDIISILASDATVLYESPSVEFVLGYTPEELLGKNAFDFIHPEDVAEVMDYFKESINRPEAAPPVEYRFRHKDNSWRIMESVGRQFSDPSNGTVGIVNSRDITNQRKAMEAQRESENLLHTFFDNAAIGIALVNEKGRSVQTNKALEEMLGYTGAELRRMAFIEVTHPDDAKKDLSSAERIFAGSLENYQIEKRYVKKNGEIMWGCLTASALRISDGSQFIIEMIEDITARKQTNAALRESEERFRTQYKALPIPTTTWKKIEDDFVLVDFNDAAMEITHGKIVNFLGIRAGKMYSEAPQLIEDFNRCFNEKTTVKRKTPFKFITTGSVKYLDITCVFIQPDIVMVHYRDITGQIQAEESLRVSENRFQLVSRATNDALWDWDLTTNKVWYSEACYKLLGYEPQEGESSIELWTDSIHPDDKERVAEYSRAVIQNRENYWTDEYRLRSADGSYVHILDRSYIIYDEEGKPLRMIGAALNITGRKLAEQALEINQARLQKQNKVLSELTKHYKLFQNTFLTAVREITEIASHTLEVERVSVWLYEDNNSKLRAIDLYELTKNSHSEGFELTETDYPRYFQALVDDEEIIADDARTDIRTSEFTESYLEPLGIASMLDAPIRIRGKVIGVVCHEHIGEAREWKLDEQNFAGSIANSISLVFEANERRQAEDALRHSQHQYASLIDSIEGIVWEADAETFKFTFVSKQAERLLGYPVEKWINEPDFWAQHIYPDDRQWAVNLCKTAVAEHQNHEFDYRMIAADGRVVWLHDIITVDSRDKSDIHLRGVMVDITNSKQAEAAVAEANERAIREYDRLLHRLSTLAQKSGAARDLSTIFTALLEFAHDSVPCSALFISLYDEEKAVRKGIYMWYNGKEEDVSNLAPIRVGEGSAGQAIKSGEVTIVNDFLRTLKKPNYVYIGFEEDDRQPRSCIIAPMKMMGKVIGAIEVQSYDLNAYAEEHAAAMRMAANIAANAIENVRLLEQERSRAEQLRQSQKLESVGRLAGGIAHDFNNMLTAINGYSDLTLRRLEPDSPLRKNIEEIKKAGERSAALTHQLLAFSRRQVLKPKVIDINHAITDVSMMLKRLIGEDVQLITNLAPKLGSVEADPGQLTQVIMNLAVNARDAMPDGGEVTIETSNVYLDEDYAASHISARAGSYVMMAVSDTGTGMDDETLQHIFEPFYTTKETGKGTGLGLATVYGIVKQSGGYIWVYSEVDKGSVFKIYLPRIDEEIPSVEDSGETEKILNRTGTILLVEDEDMVRNLSRQILETCGYTVIEATNGAEALEFFEQPDFKVDLILTDVVMPKMSGRQLAEQLEIQRPGMKVLYMSGYTDDSIVRQGIIETGSNFIQKPFTFKGLAAKVKEMMDA